jgi:hypothetical protein
MFRGNQYYAHKKYGGGGINLFRIDSGTHLTHQTLHFIHFQRVSLSSRGVVVAEISMLSVDHSCSFSRRT